MNFETVKIPMYDTGIGQAAGYKDDAELVAAAEAERAMLSPEVRDLVDELDRRLEHRALFGDSDAV